MKKMQDDFCVLGSGIWGTAIATQIARRCGSCTIFTKTLATAQEINELHTNKGARLSANIFAQTDFSKLAAWQNVILAAPSYALYDMIEVLKFLPSHINLILASKGLDTLKIQLMSQTLQEQMLNKIMIMGGASFADEVINNQFTAINLAASNLADAQQFAAMLSSESFAVVPCNDVVGLQLAGAIKNVAAILVGIVRSSNYGENLCSYLIAKTIEEIKRFAFFLDPASSPADLAIYSDVIMCCTSIKSRNLSFGMQLANGIAGDKVLVEGRFAAKALVSFAAKCSFESKLLTMASQVIENPAALAHLLSQFSR